MWALYGSVMSTYKITAMVTNDVGEKRTDNQGFPDCSNFIIGSRSSQRKETNMYKEPALWPAGNRCIIKIFSLRRTQPTTILVF